MAAINKNNLGKLLNFLNNEIINEPANAWFVEELRKILPDNQSKHGKSKPDALERIEKYLALDYEIDKEYSLCDYSFLDKYMREKAESDFREMKRFKLGLRGHKKDFGEFCRYVILQTELMLNFFYDEYYEARGGITEIVRQIKIYNTSSMGTSYYNPDIEKVNSAKDIPFNYKLWAFSKQYGVKRDLLDAARKLRNKMSHRSCEPDESHINELYRKLLSYGIKFSEDGTTKYMNRELLYNNDVIEYKFEHFLKQQPFDKLEDELRDLVDKIYSLVKTE